MCLHLRWNGTLRFQFGDLGFNYQHNFGLLYIFRNLSALRKSTHCQKGHTCASKRVFRVFHFFPMLIFKKHIFRAISYKIHQMGLWVVGKVASRSGATFQTKKLHIPTRNPKFWVKVCVSMQRPNGTLRFHFWALRFTSQLNFGLLYLFRKLSALRLSTRCQKEHTCDSEGVFGVFDFFPMLFFKKHIFRATFFKIHQMGLWGVGKDASRSGATFPTKKLHIDARNPKFWVRVSVSMLRPNGTLGFHFWA